MYARKNQKLLPCLLLLAGCLGMGLRLLLNTVVRDQRDLIPAWHPLSILLWVLTFGALGLALYGAMTLEEAQGYRQSFPGSLVGCLGHGFAALGILLTVLLGQPAVFGNLGTIWKVLGFASVPCLAAAGWFRLRGRQPFFLLHLCPAAFLMFHAINNYQIWSSDPQILNFSFSLLGVVSMVFFAFYHCAFDADLEWRNRLTFFALASGYLALTAVPGCSYPWVYLGCGLWALMDRPAPVVCHRCRPAMEEREE